MRWWLALAMSLAVAGCSESGQDSRKARLAEVQADLAELETHAAEVDQLLATMEKRRRTRVVELRETLNQLEDKMVAAQVKLDAATDDAERAAAKKQLDELVEKFAKARRELGALGRQDAIKEPMRGDRFCDPNDPHDPNCVF